MKTVLMYTIPSVYNKGTKAEYEYIAEWELFIDTAGTEKLPFGYVSSKVFPVKPTKRQIRKAKKEHRREKIEAIERREWEDSWEAIHCDIIGL